MQRNFRNKVFNFTTPSCVAFCRGLVIVALVAAVVIIIMDGMVVVLGLVFSGLCSDQPDREEAARKKSKAVKNMGLQIYLWTRRRMLHLQYPA